MGQYFKVVNITKKEQMRPHNFGSGAKLMEFSSDGMSIMQGLAILLADGNGRGGGDLRSENPIIGSWAGDQIVITGDYADEGNFTDDPQKNLYEVSTEYKDVSFEVQRALADDGWWKQNLYEDWKQYNFHDWNEDRQSFKEEIFGKQENVEENA